jgi:predicted dehydrogenase
MTIRTIHVGVGGRGQWPIDVLGEDSRFEPVALVDLNPEFLARAQEQLHLPSGALFSDFETALNSVDADAVVICTPTRSHAALCRQAFAAKKHVLVEKGMTMDWKEAQALVKEADENGVKFCVSQNYRYGAVEQAIKALVDNTSHLHHPGPIEIVDMIHHRYRPEPRTLNYPFAMVWDMSCHHVDLLSFWLGPVRRVTAIASNPSWSAYEHDADIAATLEYESGAICHYVLTHAATFSDYRLVLQGSRGALRAYDVAGLQFYPLPSHFLGASKPVEQELVPPPRTEQGVVDDFYNYLCHNVEPGISGRQNLQTLAVCEMLVRSATEKRTVERAEIE